MGKVLIISPHFPPTNAADHQRIRSSLPYFGATGWAATILAVSSEHVEAPVDQNLDRTVPTDITVVRTTALPIKLARYFGLGSLAFRALPFFWKSGSQMLRQQAFDLVYFSTTMFPVLILGPLWKRRFGVPYVVDFQDPWLTDYYTRPGAPEPPGGRVKHSFHMWIAKKWERQVMQEAAETIVVSPAYAEMLRKRYSCVSPGSITVLPFGAAENDFRLLSDLDVRQRVFERGDGMTHWVYVGRGGADMATALEILFGGIARNIRRDPERWSKLRIHFAGTDYAPRGQGRPTILPLAKRFGVADLVSEITDRLPYFETLQALVDADALLVIGSDSPGYTPSKLYPYVLAKRPMLAILHGASPAIEILERSRAADVITFGLDADVGFQAIDAAVMRLLHSAGNPPNTDWSFFARFSARAMTEKQATVFNRAIAATKS